MENGWSGVVSVIRVGDESALAKAMDREQFLRTTIPQMAGVFYATVAIFMLLIWLQRRQDEMFGYFGLAALVKAQWVSFNFGYWSAVSEPYGSLANNIGAVYAQPVLLFIYCLRFAGWRWPRAERAMWLFAIAMRVLQAFDTLYPGHVLLHKSAINVILPMHYASFVLMLYIVRRQPSADAVLLVLGHLYSVVTVTYEWFVPALEGLSFFPVHLVPLFLVMGWILTRRFVRSLNNAEQLNAELEQNYQRLHALEQQQAVVAERQRIMSDMHDGIGGQLISTLSLVEHGESSSAEVAAALRECIDDLRLTIDSLEPTENDLLPVLGNFRYRLEGRLKKQGIDLDWQVKEVPKLACLTPQNVLQVLRIMQEAFTNVLKHAHASRISVETGVDGGNRVFIRVRDNGNGFAGDHKGRGLDNMKRRARTVGGDLDIQPSPTGTTLSLLLPVT